MQFQVPQFIETEDKIVGPFSLRQFAYIGIGGILSAFLYFIAQTWLWAIGSFFIFAIAIGLAFVKVEGRPLANVIVSAFNFYWSPQTYIWKPEHKAATLSASPKTSTESGGSIFAEMIAKSAQKTKPVVVAPSKPIVAAKPVSRETASSGSALHKSWENVQTGAAFEKKNSDKQFLEKKMSERYQIFQRVSGDREAAKRVDYR